MPSPFLLLSPYWSLFVLVHPYSLLPSLFVLIIRPFRPFSSLFVLIRPYSSLFVLIHPYFILILPFDLICPYSSLFVLIHLYSIFPRHFFIFRAVTRAYWMIYRGPCFLAVVWFSSSPTPSHSPVSKLDRRFTGRMRKRNNLLTGEGWRMWARSQIIPLQESMALDKSFNTLWQ